jgi:hypothetical protein
MKENDGRATEDTSSIHHWYPKVITVENAVISRPFSRTIAASLEPESEDPSSF